ncbi:MAG: nucleotidyltransferase family protein [Eubacterium sp.]|nr:nucleotidyltransferase family protein [Eubacterium sp.]
MRVTGIICEFNPFHQGHQYLMEQARLQTGCDYVVCVMNGDFVQRGEPAILDKYTRTQMALDGGADFVFELPVRFGISSAGDFAYGGVKALTSLPFVTDLCFGSEWGEIDLFLQTASALSSQSQAFSSALKKYNSQGLSFPAARERALMETFSLPHSLLAEPNNTLGVEYCLALQRCESSMVPHTISRVGQGYHDTDATSAFPSATALRQQIYESDAPHLGLDDFSDLIGYALRREEQLERYKDISPELANRIKGQLDSYGTPTEFMSLCQTRVFTEGRIKRSFLQALVGLTETDDSMPYLRLLGMKKTASHLLKQVTDCQILNRLAVDRETLSHEAKVLLQQDILASDLYRMIWNRKYNTFLPNEYQHSPIII